MRNNKLIIVLMHFLQVFMQMCMAVSMTNLMLHGFMKYEEFHAFNTLYIGVVVILLYLAKNIIRNERLSLIAHILIIASTLVVTEGELEEQAMVFLPALCMGIYSMKRKDERPFMPLELGVILGAYILGLSISAKSALIIPFYSAIIYVVCLAVWTNINNMNKFVSDNLSSKSYNIEQAVGVNSIMIGAFSVVLFVVMYCIPKLHLQSIIASILLVIWRGIAYVLRDLLAFLPEDSAAIEESLKNAAASEELDMGLGLSMNEGSEILNLIFFAFGFVLLFFILLMIIRAIKNIGVEKATGIDVKEFVKPTIKSKKNESKSTNRLFDIGLTNDMAVRKIYAHMVKKSVRKMESIDKTMTPSELTVNYIKTDDSSITGIYEKARYGNEEITSDELLAMKQYIQRYK